MKQVEKIVIIALLLTPLVSCNRTLYYNRASHFTFPHGSSNYSEVQFHDDGTYEEYNFTSANHTNYNCYNGNYKRSGDTIIVTGNYWDYDDNYSAVSISDSTVVMGRFLVRKNQLIEASYAGNFDSISPIFKKGKSRKLRKLEKKDSLIWFNNGYLREPFSGGCQYHGLDDHDENCTKCLQAH